VTEPGEWGRWINGGGWLTVGGIALDLLFRNTKEVVSTIDDCLNGIIIIDYQCGHPFGFVNAIYMGELHSCTVLFSNNDIIQQQKERLTVFPERYRRAVIEKFLWECGFSLQCGAKAADKRDVLYAAGSLFRCAVCLLQVLYALNGMYMLNEKGSLSRLLKEKDAYIPEGFADDVASAFMLGGDSIKSAFSAIQRQFDAISRRCGYHYQA
jgi:hypothetical protein